MSELTKGRIAEIRERAESTTPVPWRLWDDGTSLFVHIPATNGHICITQMDSRDRRANMDFVAHAHQDIPDLLAALDAANARIAELERLLEKSETRTVEIEQWTEKDELVAALYRARKSADCAEDLNDKLLSALCDMVNQACQVEMDGDDPIVSHSGLSAYEDAFALLEKLGCLEQLRRGYRLTWPKEEASDR